MPRPTVLLLLLFSSSAVAVEVVVVVVVAGGALNIQRRRSHCTCCCCPQFDLASRSFFARNSFIFESVCHPQNKGIYSEYWLNGNGRYLCWNKFIKKGKGDLSILIIVDLNMLLFFMM